MRFPIILSIIATSAVAVVGVQIASAAPAALPLSLSGGGPGGSFWDVTNSGGTDNGLPAGGDCLEDDGTGLTIEDAEIDPEDSTIIGTQGDAYDNGALLWLNNSIFIAPDSVDLTGQVLTAGPVPMSGLNVTMQYYAAAGSATLRTVIHFQNPSDGAINATAAWANNHGSDEGTEVQGTSSGDTAFSTADRWIVTSDDATEPGDPVNTYVLFGPGSPAVTPESASLVVFDCADTPGVMDTFDISVPAGATRHLMFFNQMNQTNAEGLSGGAGFDANPPVGGDLLSGLSEQQLSEVLNWDFGAAPPEPTNTPVSTVEPGEPTLDVTVSDDSPSTGEDVDVTAQVLDENGNPVEGTQCTFTIASQPGNDASVEAGPVATDAEGNATTTLHTGSTEGTVEVEADCEGMTQVLAVEVGAAIAAPDTGSGGPDSSAPAVLWLALATLLATTAGAGALSYARRR